MNMKLVFLNSLVIILSITSAEYTVITASDGNYEPKWESLDKRPTPGWYDEAKIGIFLHWGLYSVPSFGSEWFWMNWKANSTEYVQFMKKNYPEGFTYQDFGPQFTAEFYNPKDWAKLFERAGAKYVVLTSKHHEGFTMWPSKYSFSWNAKDLGPHRDLLGELADAIRSNTKIKFGVYHSMFEWFHPLYLADRATNFTKNDFAVNKIIPELIELVENYKPEIIWSDGDWEASDDYWQSKEFLAWLYNNSPVRDTVLVNDRWGKGIGCHHGDFYNCADRYNPGVLQKHKWESAMTIDKYSWGYRRNIAIEDFYSSQALIENIAEVISCGGNILMNIGPTKEGLIIPTFQERLLDVGKWLSINGEAIYASKPWIYQKDNNNYTWYTAKERAVYAINLKWPPKNELVLKQANDLFQKSSTVATLLGDTRKLKWVLNKDGVHVMFPDKATVNGDWAWVLKILS